MKDGRVRRTYRQRSAYKEADLVAVVVVLVIPKMVAESLSYTTRTHFVISPPPPPIQIHTHRHRHRHRHHHRPQHTRRLCIVVTHVAPPLSRGTSWSGHVWYQKCLISRLSRLWNTLRVETIKSGLITGALTSDISKPPSSGTLITFVRAGLSKATIELVV
jgi:hypothetical protein